MIEVLAQGVTLYCGDCREILPALARADAIVTDPPYGLGEKWSGGWPLHVSEGIEWDAETCEFVLRLPEFAEHCIIWGGHLYRLPPRGGYLIWDKIVRNFTSGVAELAWTTLDQPIKAMNYSNGSLASEGKVHPTQKPLPIMQWCIAQLPAASQAIADPYMGSGTTGVAAVKSGRKFVGIERERKYFDIARRRIEAALSQQDLFITIPPQT